MRRCPDHPLVAPFTDPWTSERECPVDGRRDLVPDVFDVITEATRAYVTQHQHDPADVRLGRDRYEEAVRIARTEFGTDLFHGPRPTLFGLRVHVEDGLQPDAVLVGRYVNGEWDLGISVRPTRFTWDVLREAMMRDRGDPDADWSLDAYSEVGGERGGDPRHPYIQRQR